MDVSVEVSMYPLHENYLSHIDGFLKVLHESKGVEVQTNVMSTQIFGPMDEVFQVLQNAIEQTYAHHDQCPFVVKVLKNDVSGMDIKAYTE